MPPTSRPSRRFRQPVVGDANENAIAVGDMLKVGPALVVGLPGHTAVLGNHFCTLAANRHNAAISPGGVIEIISLRARVAPFPTIKWSRGNRQPYYPAGHCAVPVCQGYGVVSGLICLKIIEPKESGNANRAAVRI